MPAWGAALISGAKTLFATAAVQEIATRGADALTHRLFPQQPTLPAPSEDISNRELLKALRDRPTREEFEQALDQFEKRLEAERASQTAGLQLMLKGVVGALLFAQIIIALILYLALT